MKSDYQERKENRINRFKTVASKLQTEANKTYEQAHQMASIIPFGQPILIGHHSEQRDRNYRDKIHRKFGKSFKLNDKAKHYQEKAIAAEQNTAISSDNPDAIELLKEKISSLEKSQAEMKAVNKAFKKDGMAALNNFDSVTKEAALSNLKYSNYGVPFPPYSLTNNNSNIKRLKNRLALLEKQAQDVTNEREVKGIKIIDNVEDNRLQIFFPNIPSPEVRDFLKSRGFHYSKYNSCWQRFRSNAANYYAEKLLEML